MRKRTVNATVAVLALVFGGLIYVVLQENTYISRLFENSRSIVFLRSLFFDCEVTWITFYLPDFLWGLALSCSLIMVFTPSIKNTICCGLVAAMCGIAWEIMQSLQVVSGTGDLLDVVMYFLACITGIIINLGERRT